ncbi:MAG: DNA polymerase Y family protein [Parvibaculum sp.]|uniref:Y-family DNA polymerase n=1 Tax=Parvibaculum sp. TaxID=2024848 RepID=UPI003C74D130
MSEQRRIAAVFLPHWPVDRFCRALERQPDRPSRRAALAFAMPGQGGLRITARTQAAAQEGIGIGQRVADAMALYPGLDVRPADFEADRAALKRLADWCGRYTPWTTPDSCGVGEEPDGILMDITGCDHLFGGEAALLDDLVSRFRGFHIRARVAAASTPGAAWALARFGEAAVCILPKGEEERALAALPVAALRLSGDTVDALARLGLKRIGDLYGRARAPVTARFGRSVALRLDEALGFAAEPISPELPLVPYRARLIFAEGLVRVEDIETATQRLAEELCVLLERYHKGARRLELKLFRVDGEVTTIFAGTSAASRMPSHLARLFREKLQQGGDDFDAGYGIEAMSLAALAVDSLVHAQSALTGEGGTDRDIEILIDRLGNRFGPARVKRLYPRASHVPEQAVASMPCIKKSEPVSPGDWRIGELQQLDGAMGRPLRMFAAAEPIEVMAEIPEGPPRNFRWRRVLYQIKRAEGPERIAPEWWRSGHGRTRDYYRVEDVNGRRFWLYRDGLYERDAEPPHWYIHGMFG